MLGEIETYGIHPDGRRELIEKGNNLVVNSAYVAVAMAMSLDPTFEGFMWWAIGEGDGTPTTEWDAGVLAGTIKPSAADTQLASEIFRKQIAAEDIKFINAQNQVSATPTNRLQITLTFEETEPYADQTAFLREWGIFGGNATAAVNSGYLINRKVHKTYEKTQFSKLERVLRFTF